jgi:hypothetical protein
MSLDWMRQHVLDGIAQGALDAAAIERYDAEVERTRRGIAEMMDTSRPRGLELLSRICVNWQWPLQPCERGEG